MLSLLDRLEKQVQAERKKAEKSETSTRHQLPLNVWDAQSDDEVADIIANNVSETFKAELKKVLKTK